MVSHVCPVWNYSWDFWQFIRSPWNAWTHLQWNDAWRWPNFNIADSLLVLGAIALLWKAYGSKSQSDFGLETVESADAKEKISND